MIANAQQRKKTFKTNIFKCFLERASISNFCCAINQNNPRKYVSYDRSHLLQPCGKFLSWASPIPLGNFYPIPPPHPLGISINHPWGGGGMDIFWNHTICHFRIMAICTRCPFLLSHLNFAKPLMYFFLKFYPGFPSIYPGSRLTVGISALLVMAVVLYHSLTGQALNDILKLIWLHCLGCSDFLQSINALKN